MSPLEAMLTPYFLGSSLKFALTASATVREPNTGISDQKKAKGEQWRALRPGWFAILNALAAKVVVTFESCEMMRSAQKG